MTFGNSKFTRFLSASTAVLLVECILVLSDSVIAGRVLGEEALGAVNLLIPLFTGFSFFIWLLAIGTSSACSEAISHLRRDRAAHLSGLGLILACLLGLVLASVFRVLADGYFTFMAADGLTRTLALAYGKWYPLAVCLEAVEILLLNLVYAHGGERDCLVSYVTRAVVNVTLSYALCDGRWGFPALGLEGVTLGTVLAHAAGLAMLLPAIFGHRGGIHFAPRWIWSDLFRSLRANFGHSSTRLFHALFFLTVAKYCIVRYGCDSLPVVAVVFCIVRLTVIFSGVGFALQPLETAYHSEGNELAARNLFRLASFISVLEGVLLTGLSLVAPELIVSLVGISDPELYAASIHAVRLTVVGLCGYAITHLLNSHYRHVGCPNRSVFLAALAYFGVPTALMFTFGACYGMTGVFLAVAAGPLVSLAAFLPIFRRSNSAKSNTHMWSVLLDDLTARSEVVDGVAKMLSADETVRGGRRLTDILLLAFRRLEEANTAAIRPISVEISLLFGAESVQLIIRDDGPRIALDDLGVPVIHLPTTNFNRNIFTQPLAKKKARLFGLRPHDRRYIVLRGKDATPEDINGVIALDRASFDECYQVAPEQDRELFLANRENGLIVKDRQTNAIVGYSMILPVKEDVYELIRAGHFVDTALTKDMVPAFDKPGEYRIYFAAVVIHPKHRGASLLLTMVEFMVEDFISLAERGIYGKTLTADVVSREGEKLAQLLGLKEICKTDHGSRIFEATALPPELRETTPATERLIGLYWERFVKERLSSRPSAKSASAEQATVE